MDEREKLRKFRELDDAFSEALRNIDDFDIPTGPPIRPQDDREQNAQLREQAFDRRLQSLMHEYAQPEESVRTLLETLKSFGRIA
jgi:hypothetical protein